MERQLGTEGTRVSGAQKAHATGESLFTVLA